MNCESLQNSLIDLLYEEENPETILLREHLQTCVSCSKSFQDFRAVKNLYQNLKEIPAPAYLTEKVFSKIKDVIPAKPVPEGFSRGAGIPRVHLGDPGLRRDDKIGSFFGRWSTFVFHPAMVAVLIFSLTVGITYFAKDFYSSKSGSDFTFQTDRENSYPSGVRMADWNTTPQVSPDLDRPILKTAELSSLEQASVEVVASFKHQRALHYIIDGDYQRASELLESLAKNDLNYSRWEEAVAQHLELMKKMNRPQEMKKDLERLKEYAAPNQELIARAEMVMQQL